MDREWQEELIGDKNPLEDETLTKKEKLFSGYYSFPYVWRLLSKKFGIAEANLQFLKQTLKSRDKKVLDNIFVSFLLHFLTFF